MCMACVCAVLSGYLSFIYIRIKRSKNKNIQNSRWVHCTCMYNSIHIIYKKKSERMIIFFIYLLYRLYEELIIIVKAKDALFWGIFSKQCRI